MLGISLPSGEMQDIVMRKAYKNASLDASGTDYVECHEHLLTVSTNGVPVNGAMNGDTNGFKTNATPIIGVQENGTEDQQKFLLMPMSAASTNSLKLLVQQISNTVLQSGDIGTLQSIAHTLFKCRDYLRYWKHTVTEDDAPSKGTVDPLLFAFVFTGQGAQYPGMGKELVSQSQHFRNTIRDRGSWSR
ncbi:hypothetical protein TSTA_101450 [Talaromyces stipitatus ATCC 10500]|uniref:Uncharacterized protein n=1 Tax=Talaromyces stipitatus (strain ATCC 10500 / CBS 375.48 / QM 6759 / NRRL 1006) TaxID=441959 RepID=B8MLP2_TALSN|nr:uncharacterized protein TSTA_101450 [Talaromyces stipitatus ATCC 10500]EED13905.1 hypothetical protein TSTA_101450 [Talaromyces stipitatus ATCC 10500]